MDFLTRKYVSFFEYFLEFLYGVMEKYGYNLWDLFIGENKNSKIMMVLTLDFSMLFESMKFYEAARFNPEEFRKIVEKQYPVLSQKNIKFQKDSKDSLKGEN